MDGTHPMNGSTDGGLRKAIMLGGLFYGREFLAVRQTDDGLAVSSGSFFISASLPSFVVALTLSFLCFLLAFRATLFKSVTCLMTFHEFVCPSVSVRVGCPLQFLELAIHVDAPEVFFVEPLEAVGGLS